MGFTIWCSGCPLVSRSGLRLAFFLGLRKLDLIQGREILIHFSPRIVKVVVIVIGIVVFIVILSVVCCCCLPCCFLAKRRTRNRGEVHQPAGQPLQSGAAYNQPQQPPGYQLQQASGGGYPPQQPAGYQAPSGGFQSPPAGYYPPPEQQQMVPPGYPAQPPPYPGPPQGGFPTNNQEPFATKQAPYNPNAP